MGQHLIIFGTFIELIILQTAMPYIHGCHFFETVNLTGSQSFENGSYMYEDIVVPVNFTGLYDYITTELEINETTESHLRGCVCRLKPCIWICCRFKDWDASRGKCTDSLMEDLSNMNPLLDVTLGNGSEVEKYLLKDFVVVRRSQIDSRGYDCIHPNQFTSDSTGPLVAAYHEYFYYEPQLEPNPIKTTVLWLSEVSLIFTIAVYVCLKKLRNLHGKCFICYLSILFMNDFYEVDNGLQFCVLQGYFVHFFSIAKFSWLLTLSHQLWRGLSSVNRDESEYSFRAYNIFAWGTPAVLTGVPFLIEQIWDSDPNKVKWVPGMGWENCYLKDRFFLLGYVILPLGIMLSLNTILFIWTIISIIRVKLLLRHFTDQSERKQNLNSRMQKYYLFLRLATMMDMRWSVMVFSFFLGWEFLVKILYYCDSCFGIIIFILFVLKRSTLKLLMECIRNRSD